MQSLTEKNVYTNHHLAGKHLHVHVYLLYPSFHQAQSQEGVELGSLIIISDKVNIHTCRLVCFEQRNKNY